MEAVMPKTYGQRRHPLFFLGCPWRRNPKQRNSIVDMTLINETEVKSEAKKYFFETKYLLPENFEPAPAEF